MEPIRYRGKKPAVFLSDELIECLQGNLPWEYLKFHADEILTGHPVPDDIDEQEWEAFLEGEFARVSEVAGTFNVGKTKIAGAEIVAVNYDNNHSKLVIRLLGYSKKSRAYEIVVERYLFGECETRVLAVYREPKPAPHKPMPFPAYDSEEYEGV